MLFAVRDPYLDFTIYSMPFPLKFRGLKKRITDGRTNGRTDRPSYREAWTHLKMWRLFWRQMVIFSFFVKYHFWILKSLILFSFWDWWPCSLLSIHCHFTVSIKLLSSDHHHHHYHQQQQHHCTNEVYTYSRLWSNPSKQRAHYPQKQYAGMMMCTQ